MERFCQRDLLKWTNMEAFFILGGRVVSLTQEAPELKGRMGRTRKDERENVETGGERWGGVLGSFLSFNPLYLLPSLLMYKL